MDPEVERVRRQLEESLQVERGNVLEALDEAILLIRLIQVQIQARIDAQIGGKNVEL